MTGLLALLLTAGADMPPVYLNRADDAHHWKPRAAIVAAIERRLAVPARMGGPAANFDRYYTGVFRGGHKMVVVELVNLVARPPNSGRVHVVAPNRVPAIGDGGCGVVSFSHDMDTGADAPLQCNFALPVPPPPS